jgi:hypothetical protein
MSPWRAYLLMCRIIPDGQVPLWTSTHGDMISSDLMGLKAHQMDAETPTGGKDMLEGLHRRRGGRSTRGNLAEPYPGGLCPFQQDVGLGRPMTQPKTLMTSSSDCGGFGRQL